LSEDVELDYEYLATRALRRVVYDVLTLTAELGKTPGKHHFFIEFETDAAGVVMPEHLRGEWPGRMTIVLQHQFDALEVDERGFSVTLWFKGKPARLTIPFDAVTGFADPHVKFSLRFEEGALVGKKPEAAPAAAAETPPSLPKPETVKPKDGEKVISLDQFRKK
jgi:hypothetical protein